MDNRPSSDCATRNQDVPLDWKRNYPPFERLSLIRKRGRVPAPARRNGERNYNGGTSTTKYGVERTGEIFGSLTLEFLRRITLRLGNVECYN